MQLFDILSKKVRHTPTVHKICIVNQQRAENNYSYTIIVNSTYKPLTPKLLFSMLSVVFISLNVSIIQNLSKYLSLSPLKTPKE
jgi:hypothetical protein